MANTTPAINLTSLDFFAYKSSLKTWLQSQTIFADYNWDGANLDVLLDLLAYNTYMNGFYLNMVGSEMFLDTAQLRDSVVLRAKELNYTPRSFKAAQAVVNLVVANVPNNPVLLTIPSGTSFSAKAGSNTYTFSTQQNIVLNANTDGNFYASNVTIYEGTTVTDTFVVQPLANVNNQAFTLSNPTIDTSTLTVVSIENNGANVVPYFMSTTLLDLTEQSTVYFLQGGDNSQYQIIFGDNVVGRRPADNGVVLATYLVTNGQLPNGVGLFTPNGTIGGSSNVSITTVTPASGGDISEDINSIRYNAPRYYATQERCVTEADYETLMSVTFPEIEAISAYGGDKLPIPQYGKVFIALKLFGFDAIPNSKITAYTNFLSTRAPLTTQPVFTNPDLTYASITSTVKYNVNSTVLEPSDIEAFVTSAIQTYSQNELENFNTTLYYSKFCTAIDAAHSSIISNETTYRIMKKLVPSLSTVSNYTINFNIPMMLPTSATALVHPTALVQSVRSSLFTYNGLVVAMEDDGAGNLRIVQSQSDGNDHTIVTQGIGTVDYENGVVYISNFQPSAYVGDSIRFYVQPRDLDNTVSLNQVFEIPNDEINVTAKGLSQ